LALLVVFSGVIYLYTSINDWYEQRPKVIKELDGIKIGASISDLKFSFEDLKRNEETSRRDQEQYANKNDGFYDLNDGKNSVEVINGKISRVVQRCDQESVDYTTVNSISCNDSSEKIVEKFGSEVIVLCALKSEQSGGLEEYKVRKYRVKKYNIEYYLYLNKVIAFIAVDSLVIGEQPKKFKECADG
jgi:hypothetical protein